MKIFFDHIPKTAGMSIQNFFAEAFGANAVSANILGMKLEDAVRVYSDMKVLIGHIHIMPGDRLPNGYLTSTILRDPRERTLSLFYFIKYQSPELNLDKGGKIIKSLSLEEALYNEYFVNQVCNAQSKHFASYFQSSLDDLPPSELLEIAQKGLSQYDIVGTAERIDEFSNIFKILFDLPTTLAVKRINVTSNKKKYLDIPVDCQKRISELNEVDLELWRFAERLFETKKSYPKQLIFTSCSADQKTKGGSSPIAPQVISEKGSVELRKIYLIGQLCPVLQSVPKFVSGELVELHIILQINKDIEDVTIGYSVHHDSGINMFGVNTRLLGKRIDLRASAVVDFIFTFPVNLGIGNYHINLVVHTGLSHLECCYLFEERAAKFIVMGFMDIQFEGFARLIPNLNVILQNNSKNQLFAITEEIEKEFIVGENNQPVLAPKGTIDLLVSVERMLINSQISLPVVIKNASSQKWSSLGNRPVFISYHWRNIDESFYAFDGIRTQLPGGVILPNMKSKGTAFVEAPSLEGVYILEMTLIQEGVCWLENKGFRTSRYTITVFSEAGFSKMKEIPWWKRFKHMLVYR